MKRSKAKTAFWMIFAMIGTAQCYPNIVISGGTSGVPTSILIPYGLPILIDPVSGADGDLSSPASWKKSKTWGGSIDLLNAAYYDPTTKGVDFYYQVQNITRGPKTSTDTVNPTITLLGFAGFTTNVFQISKTTGGSVNLFGNSSVSFKEPTANTVVSVLRSGVADEGNTLTITFSGIGIAPGKTSAILEVQTNATNFDAAGGTLFQWMGTPPVGAVGAANTQSFDLSTLEPVVAAEPSFYWLLSAGLIALVLSPSAVRTTVK